jgi:hypothetical protein
MMIAAGPDQPWVYWAALVLPIIKGQGIHGNLRLIANGAAGSMSAGLSQTIMVPALQDLLVGEQGGVVVVGLCNLGVISQGMLGLSIHGLARNARVMWTAVSCAAERVILGGDVPV